ncbi:MAG TPA: hypothetical protein VFL90_16715 [Methylomirabilota bacterium]|nr:hypothetical protein [Methylomirabilota bacterium]
MSTLANELPRCVNCRLSVAVGENVVFRRDGRVEHASCPKVLCPVCLREVAPRTPIRRDGNDLLHPACWARRYREAARRPA